MKVFDFVIIGGGIAGLAISYFLKEKNILLIDKKGILEGASGAAGAFLFPKIGLKSRYTDFINSSLIFSFKFYEKLRISTHKKGVLLLPRDERDIEKFKNYEKHITLPFKKREGGFFFKDGGFVEVDEIKEKIKSPFLKEEVVEIKKENDLWKINDIYSKNIILATGYENIMKIPYIKIRPVWGERIEIKSEKCKVKNEKLNFDIFYHKNCSIAKVGDKLRIGATHKRNCLECRENEKEAKELIEKAREVINIENYEIVSIKGGQRSASIDYFPVLGNVIDVDKTLKINPKVIKGEFPKEIKYIKGLYIINGMGGRGFSNALMCAKMLKEFIFERKDLGVLDSKRLFIKWARKEGERYINKHMSITNYQYIKGKICLK